MKGILVFNHFLKNSKFDTLHEHILKSAELNDIDLNFVSNLEVATNAYKCDFALFWDKDINAALKLENQGIPCFNSASAIELCDDKAKTYLKLQNVVSQPETLIGPLSYERADMTEFVNNAVNILGLPLVYKDCFGSFGAQVHLCNSKEDILSHITEKPFLLQQYITESSGTDFRLEVVDGKVVSAVKRYNDNDFRSNVTNGGTMEVWEPTKEQCDIAVRACESLGLTFGGVDILNNNMVCEVNSNAHIINIMNTNGIDIMPYIWEAVRKYTKGN